MNINLNLALLFMMLLLLLVVDLEGKPLSRSDCSGDYSPYCNCHDTIQRPASKSVRNIYCKVSNNQDFDDIRTKLSNDTSINFGTVHFVITAKLGIPEDVLRGKRTNQLELVCSDRSTPLGSIHSNAFKSTADYSKILAIQDCDLTKTSFSFLSQFTILTELLLTSSSIKEKIDMPLLPQLKSIWFREITNFESWYSPSQTPNLEKIYMRDMPEFNDQKMDSILASMTKNFVYPRLNRLWINQNNSLTRIPPLVSIFPALTDLSLRGNPIKNLAAGSVQKGSTQLEVLYLDEMQLTNIEPGAFVGNFSSTWINLDNNAMTTFPSSVFKDLLKSMLISHSGSVRISGNPITLDCNLAWILVDNRDLLPKVKGHINNGTELKNLKHQELIGC